MALLLAVPVITWWAVGDLSAEGTDLDYAFRPPSLTRTAETRLGVAAVVIAAIAALVLGRRRSAVR